MTTVVGILNKEGVAIAADSAVTRKNRGTEKYTKNGNKMIRLCESVPISVMLTGNTDFLGNPWEVIVRRYRSERGKIKHSTVKDAADDFFEFLSACKCFWDKEKENMHVKRACDSFFNLIMTDYISLEADDRRDNGTLVSPTLFIREFKQSCTQIIKDAVKSGVSPHFSNYSLDDFKEVASSCLDILLFEKSQDNSKIPVENTLPKDVLEILRPYIEKAVFYMAGIRDMNDYTSVLVFTGYGSENEYPSLVSATVNEGVDGHVNYFIGKDDIIEISEERPVAICPFAQTEVINALLCGVDSENYIDAQGNRCLSWKSNMDREFLKYFSPSYNWLGLPSGICRMIKRTTLYSDLEVELRRDTNKLLKANRKKWEKALEHYDLRSMAELAECLVDLTGFQRILTFQQEGVGGAVDLAVISKTDGFCWLRRKDWYPRYSSNQYGNFGI